MSADEPRGSAVQARATVAIAVWREAAAGIVQHPARACMTALGTVIGVSVLVAVLALTSAASRQVSQAFDLQEATLVRTAEERNHPTTVDSMRFGLDSPQRALAIEGAEHSVLTWTVRERAAQHLDHIGSGPVMAATAGYVDVAAPSLRSGRAWDSGHEQRAARVAIIGSGMAAELGITEVGSSPTISIDGVPFTVVGIVDDTRRLPELLGSALIPATTALALWGQPGVDLPSLLTVVQPGSAHVVGQQLPLALSATHPKEFTVQLPPDPQGLRASVDAQLRLLFIVLAGVCLGIGIIGIANTTTIAVVERTGEIGLRRAMGASRWAIAGQFVCEAGILGTLGGCFGTALGVLATVGISAGIGWTAFVPVLPLLLGPAVGAASGALGGLLPALRASRLEPVDALRH